MKLKKGEYVSWSLGMQRDNAMQARWKTEVRNQKNVEQLF